ncbi:efflux RND transporter permease subunit, partial [Arthrospira platensis SPKY1]|nr:efflux RND transporter permease subunit [Arthrospira platensis SPKY1]
AMVSVNLSTNTDLTSVEEFENLVILNDNGAFVRLRDIATVVLGSESSEAEVAFSGETAVFMGVWVLPNANAIDVIRAVQVEMDALQQDLPPGMKARVAFDATSYIND